MTDKELIQALRHCGKFENMEDYSCVGCPAEGEGCAGAFLLAADRLEALLAENERLKAQIPQWVSVDERLPKNDQYIVTACDENAPYGEGIWYGTAVVVAELYNGYWAWDDSGTEYDLTGLVTHWMPLPEPPSTEGVE